MKTIKLTKEISEYMVDIRRALHKNPEPSWGEEQTQKRIMLELKQMGIAYKKVTKTGVVGIIDGTKADDSKSNKVVALRADIDALEIAEESDTEYKSQNIGLMHACGHDGHTAMLLGAARVLQENRESFSGQVKLIFQPAEEMLTGAKAMLAEGVLENVDAIYGQHLWADMPTGVISIEPGARMASGDPVKIEFTGKGGHGSMPNQTIDPVVVASSFLLNSNAILSREKSPMESTVFTIGKVRSGTRFNIIPETATLEGSLRCFSEESRVRAHGAIKRYAEATATMYGAKVDVKFGEGAPPLINDSELSDIAKRVAVALVGEENMPYFEKTTGSEDMAYYLSEIPGVFGFIGAGYKDSEMYPHHHPKFDFDENSMDIGAHMYIHFALDFLEKDN